MSYFNGSRGRIHHHVWLPAGEVRSAVLFLHGYGEHVGLYDALAQRLNADGHAVHAIDEVGHGRSDGERGVIESWDVLVEDARRLAEIVVPRHPGVPLVLAGHSGGALAAFLLAARHPGLATAAVLSAGPLLPLEWAQAEVAGESGEPMELDPTAMLSTHPEYVHALLHDPLTYKDPIRQESVRALVAAWPEVEQALSDGRPEIPVLLLSGEQDPVVPVEVTRSVGPRLPHAEVRTFPGDLHDVLNEHDRDDVHDVVAAWLARVLASRRQPVGTSR
jgi:alpha-beta hydrolase superfamily lysophospholipase